MSQSKHRHLVRNVPNTEDNRKFVKKVEKVKKAMVICSGCNEEFSVYVHKKNDDAAWYVDNLPNCSLVLLLLSNSCSFNLVLNFSTSVL